MTPRGGAYSFRASAQLPSADCRSGWVGCGLTTIRPSTSETVLDGGSVEVAGHAYAGTRGVERVEVSIDGGGSWQDAELSDPLPGDGVWRQWRYEFAPEGSYDVVVRAVDGTGTVQPQERSESFPNGATGWVEKTVNAMDTHRGERTGT